jgi:hypothetical protein
VNRILKLRWPRLIFKQELWSATGQEEIIWKLKIKRVNVFHIRRRGSDRPKGAHRTGIITGIEMEDVLNLERETVGD